MPSKSLPLPDRTREWVFRLLYSHLLNPKSARQLTSEVRNYLVMDDLEWERLRPASAYVEDLREGHIRDELWERIQGGVLEALEGILSNQSLLEETIQRASKRWRLNRIGVVERSLLTLGAYEMICVQARPVRRSINRTVELAKRYGEADSKRFVNGILDQVRKNHNLEAE